MEEIINRVQKSGLITLDMTDLLPTKEIVEMDIKENLWNGLVLKEKDFRAFIADHDWSKYKDAIVAVHCSEDAIVPSWAYMLVASPLIDNTQEIYFGNMDEAKRQYIAKQNENMNMADFQDARVVIQGCADIPSPESLFLALTVKLQPCVKVLMYGEPCSTVPVYKQKKKG